ncbi:MAG TPA: hypothetical protein VEH81_02650 [Ktedonobacteraceae bacterium]|nr:hypothetical protein [Ktedonobacteraceae bacterium]
MADKSPGNASIALLIITATHEYRTCGTHPLVDPGAGVLPVQQDRLLRSHIVTQLALLVANACHDIHQGNHLRAMATYELDVRLDVHTQLIRYSGLCFYFRYHKIRTGNVDVG